MTVKERAAAVQRAWSFSMIDHDQMREPWSYTVLLCVNCAKGCGLNRKMSIGGTWKEEPCQLCGESAYLCEYRTRIPIEAIREDIK